MYQYGSLRRETQPAEPVAAPPRRCLIHGRLLQRPRWLAPAPTVIFLRMKHRGPIASSLRTRTPAPPGRCELPSASSLPRPVAVALALRSSATCAPAGEDPHSEAAPWRSYLGRPPAAPPTSLSRALADVAPAHLDGQRVNVMTRQGGAGAAGTQDMHGRAGDPSRAPRVHG